ncbi:uncharacterized protein C8R40DRAFT_271448 [Lentinula edodes]|uniref:uncharacterized protein n=1 Tax=Lentinula edodes TaxID=5353 RepID=UPI001E8E8B76|nr:uncharacterized protein C8R40DRAFT_271448 [Lentinula edodes]KAH7880672.1 hypothetical protein C8R40DRAFT_271448 [Lentinula edodes]
MPPGTIILRSPSPTLPGAWPHTPLRSRSLTYPTLTAGPDLMHLDTAPGQRKLTSSQPASLASDETLAQSTTTGSMPSRVSELTNFTQTLSGSSISAMTKASLNTSTLTLEECMTATTDHWKTASPNSETRIHQLPSPETSSDNHVVYTTGRRVKVDQSQQQIVIEDESVDDASRSSEMSSSPNPPFHFTPSQSRSGSPMSPMIFVSPTASNRTPPAIRTEYQSYSFSSDEDGEYDDSGLLRLGSPSLPASLPSTPRSSTFSSPARAWRQNVSVVNISPISEDLNSSTEGLQVSSQRRLTSLSLPGSINLDDSIPDVAPFPPRVTNEHTQPDADWTLSLTGTSEPGFSPYTTSVTSPISLVARSISPSPSLRDRLQNPLVTHVVNFPSPAVTLPPSPDVPQANAGEYATAVMMSSWESAGLQLEPIGLELTRATDTLARDEVEDPLVGAPSHERRTIITSNGSRQKRGVLSKVRRFGVKLKHILQGKSKERLEIEISSSKKTTNSHSTHLPMQPITSANNSTTLGEQSMAVQATPPTLELELGSFNLEEHIPMPYPVLSTSQPTRLRKPRPSITAGTYSSSTAHDGSLINHDHPTRVPSPNADAGAITIEAYARPKTLNEIKNRQRLSLSAISNHLARPSSPSSPSTHIAVRQRRPRPASALILPSIMNSSSPQTRRQTATTPNRMSISNPIGPVYHRSGIYPLPPGLDTHVPPRTRTVRLAVPKSSSTPSQSHSRPATGGCSSNGLNSSAATGMMTRNFSQVSRVPDVDRENNRSERNRNQNRFSLTGSLSTLSSFAAGLVDHGSWARFESTKREDTS